MTYVLYLLGWVVLSAIIMSFVEYTIHRALMHKPNFLSRRTATYKRVYEAHSIVHHAYYSNIFVDEPVPEGEDKEIRLTVRKAWIKALPIALVLAFASIPGAIIFLGVVTLHHWIWNKIHLEMHKPEQRGFSKWPIYKFLARHHYLHHRHQNRNFNVVFPFADYVCGTVAKPTAADTAEMIKLGMLDSKEPPKVESEPKVPAATH
jgi:hypothetical protein